MTKSCYGFKLLASFKYLFFLLLNYLSYYSLNELGIIERFEKDLLPIFDKFTIIVLFVAGIIALSIHTYKKTASILNIFIKRYETSIKIVMFLMGIIIWQRCYGEGYLNIVYILILYSYFMLIEYESTKTFEYSILKDEGTPGCYEERPIVGRDLLTRTQIKALDQLITTLNNRKSAESVNIALIGKWGKGKTSIIDTLIYELQQYKDKNPEYFILKLDMGVLKEPFKVVEYVNNYFYVLFRQYGILSLGSFGGLTYLSALQKILEETEISFVSKVAFGQDENYFSDLESERKLFAENIAELLEVSRKKNIILIIDEADRVDRQEEIAHLLSEFSGVNGIISIMLLNESIRGSIRVKRKLNQTPNFNNGEELSTEDKAKEEEEKLNKYGKYIYLEIYIDDLEKIEYEKSIKEQIILANDRIKKEGTYYVSYITRKDKRSIFDTVSDYGTNRLAEEGHIIYGECNMLTELFNAELEEYNESFGMFLEKKVKEYFLSCNEFKSLFGSDLNIYVELLYKSLFSINDIEDNFFNWTTQIMGTFDNVWGEFCTLLQTIYMIRSGELNMSIETHFYKLSDLKALFFMSNFDHITNCSELASSFENDSNYILFKALLFSEEEEKDVVSFLNKRDYASLELILKEKAQKAINMKVLSISIFEFMRYVRSLMNNYRHFKMQIREADLLNTFYLDYLLRDWHVDIYIIQEFENIKNHYPLMQNIHPNWPSLQAFFNTIMYDEFIDKNGRDFEERQLTEIRASILTTSKRKVLIITGKDGENKVYYRAISITQNKKDSLIHEEREMLKVKVRKIYHEYRDTNVEMELIEL